MTIKYQNHEFKGTAGECVRGLGCFLLGIVLTIIAGIILIQYAEYRDNSTPPIHELRDDCRVYEKGDVTYTLCGPPWVHGDSGVK